MRPLLVTAFALAALTGGVRRAQSQVTADSTIFAVNNTTTIYTVNRLTGATTPVGTLLFATVAIARQPSTGRIYYLSSGSTNPSGRVAYWDPATNTNTLLNGTGPTDQNQSTPVPDDALAFSSTGVLYTLDGGVSTLYSINTTTGAYTMLGDVRIGTATGPGLGSTNDLAFDWNGTAEVAYLIALDGGGNTNAYTLSLTRTGAVYVATLVSGVVTGGTQEALAVGADGRHYYGGQTGTRYAGIRTAAPTAQTPAGTIAFYDFASSPRFADLKVAATSPGLPVGGVGDYTITISNGGPHSANGQITVIDSLPAGLTYQGMSGAGWSCAAAGSVVTCTTPGPLANGGTSTLDILVNVAAGTAGSPINIVRVTGSTIDWDMTNNRVAVTTATTSAAFTTTKTHTGSFTVGQNGVYTISATNSGTWATISTLTLTDTMPTGMTFVSGTGTGWTCTAAGAVTQVVTCTRPNTTPIAVGGSTSVTLTVTLGALAAPSKTNKVYLAGGGQLTSSSASDPTTVVAISVAVTPHGATTTQLPSNATSYVQLFTITNSGALSTTYNLVASRTPGTSLAITSVNGVAGTTATQTVAAGASAPVSVVYTVVAGATAGAVDTLALLATSNVNALMNDRGTLVVTVIRAGLTISKQLYRDDRVTPISAASMVAPGEFVQFKVTVTATGAAGTTLVRVTDLVPATVTFDAATGDLPGWTLTQAGGTVTGDLAGTLVTGQSRYFWIRVQIQ